MLWAYRDLVRELDVCYKPSAISPLGATGDSSQWLVEGVLPTKEKTDKYILGQPGGLTSKQ